MLARAIADKAFRDYQTVKELLRKTKCTAFGRDDILDKPFFYVICTGEMDKADTFSRCLRELGTRAGYLRPPTIHDFRAGGLYLVGMFP